MNAIKALPQKTKHLVIGVIAIMGIFLFGLAVYASTESRNIPTTIEAPAPNYSIVEEV